MTNTDTLKFQSTVLTKLDRILGALERIGRYSGFANRVDLAATQQQTYEQLAQQTLAGAGNLFGNFLGNSQIGQIGVQPALAPNYVFSDRYGEKLVTMAFRHKAIP